MPPSQERCRAKSGAQGTVGEALPQKRGADPSFWPAFRRQSNLQRLVLADSVPSGLQGRPEPLATT